MKLRVSDIVPQVPQVPSSTLVVLSGWLRSRMSLGQAPSRVLMKYRFSDASLRKTISLTITPREVVPRGSVNGCCATMLTVPQFSVSVAGSIDVPVKPIDVQFVPGDVGV